MKNDFQKIIERAVEIKKKYEKIEPKKWEVEQAFMGMTKDMGELSKLLMVKGGYRDDFLKNIKTELGHELADMLYSIIIIADKTGIDLEKSFWRTMREVEKKIKK